MYSTKLNVSEILLGKGQILTINKAIATIQLRTANCCFVLSSKEQQIPFIQISTSTHIYTYTFSIWNGEDSSGGNLDFIKIVADRCRLPWLNINHGSGARVDLHATVAQLFIQVCSGGSGCRCFPSWW